MISAAQRARAERSLTDTCVATRAVAGTWTPEDGLPDDTTTVYDGPCLLLADGDRRHEMWGGDERARFTHVLAVPHADADDLRIGDTVTVASAAEPFTVSAVDDRTNRVLARLGLVISRDAEGVAP